MAKGSMLTKLVSGLKAKLPGAKQGRTTAPRRSETPSMKLIFFIVDWKRAHVITDVFVEEKVRFHFVCKGTGTANSEILDLLGIGAGDKAVIFCLEQAVLVPVLMKEVRKKLGFHIPGQGIAFTIPLSAINDPVLLVFKQSILKNEKIAAEQTLEKERPQGEGGNMAGRNTAGKNMTDDTARDVTDSAKRETISHDRISHDLIVAIINQGYSDEFMNAAREAGATGGTVINARGQAHEGAVKFFGVSVQDEKEVIIILSSREKKVQIMRAVSEAYGLNSQAHGIIFSLPVDSVMGLGFE